MKNCPHYHIYLLGRSYHSQTKQHTRGQHYWSSVFFASAHGPLLCNARTACSCAVTSHNSGYYHMTRVFYDAFSMLRLYNAIPLVERWDYGHWREIGNETGERENRLVEYRFVACTTVSRTTETRLGDRIWESGRVLEARHSKVVEEEMTRRLHSDLKWLIN
jgi:hypothetical protein